MNERQKRSDLRRLHWANYAASGIH